jgi:hypothetical protein
VARALFGCYLSYFCIPHPEALGRMLGSGKTGGRLGVQHLPLLRLGRRIRKTTL